jgi:hypothetical protein
VIAFKRVLKDIASEDIVVLDDDCSLGVSWWTDCGELSNIPDSGWLLG